MQPGISRQEMGRTAFTLHFLSLKGSKRNLDSRVRCLHLEDI